jgi:hypothetical protein
MDSSSQAAELPPLPSGVSSGRKVSAAFLNLLVLPGLGSLALGPRRRLDAALQIGLSCLGFFLFLWAIKDGSVWALQVLGPPPAGDATYSHEQIVSLAEVFVAQPPTSMGLPLLAVFSLSFGLFFVSWVYSLVSLFLPSGPRLDCPPKP